LIDAYSVNQVRPLPHPTYRECLFCENRDLESARVGVFPFVFGRIDHGVKLRALMWIISVRKGCLAFFRLEWVMMITDKLVYCLMMKTLKGSASS